MDDLFAELPTRVLPRRDASEARRVRRTETLQRPFRSVRRAVVISSRTAHAPDRRRRCLPFRADGGRRRRRQAYVFVRRRWRLLTALGTAVGLGFIALFTSLR